jgi:hypothetical protein
MNAAPWNFAEITILEGFAAIQIRHAVTPSSSCILTFAGLILIDSTLNRLVHQHHPDRPAGRPPGRHERFVPLAGRLPVQVEHLTGPAAALTDPFGQEVQRITADFGLGGCGRTLEFAHKSGRWVFVGEGAWRS